MKSGRLPVGNYRVSYWPDESNSEILAILLELVLGERELQPNNRLKHVFAATFPETIKQVSG
jgi:hypothetical protein